MEGTLRGAHLGEGRLQTSAEPPNTIGDKHWWLIEPADTKQQPPTA
jgi:hypothetical protein